MSQRFLNNFASQFVGPVAATGSPGTLGWDILQLSGAAAGQLVNPTGGEYYLLTAFKRTGNVESFIEIMKVTAVDSTTYPGEVRITVVRAQEGTTAQNYVANDYVSLRFTAGSAASMLQKAENLADLASASAARGNLGLGTLATQNGTFSGSSSGTNTGDQTNITGNAGTATKLQTARTIDGVAFDGSANIAVLAPATHAATSKATPVDADEIPIVDSASTFTLKRLTLANLVSYVFGAARTLAGALTVSGTANSVTIAGATTGNPVTITATGTDTNVGLNVVTKGAGVFTVNGAPISGGGSSLVRSARTSNTQLTAADSGKLIDITSGTFIQTFDGVASLGAGWWAYIRNAGAGDVTLDPNGSEQIDGLTSYVMYPGEVRLLQCDGSALRSIVLRPFLFSPVASGNFVVPPGYEGRYAEVDMIGGSGGGASGAHSTSASGNVAQGGSCGGAASRRVARWQFPAAGTLIPFTLGAGGTGGAARTFAEVLASGVNFVPGLNGAAGGDTTFGPFVAYGGLGGAPGNSPSNGSSWISRATTGVAGGGPVDVRGGDSSNSATSFGGAYSASDSLYGVAGAGQGGGQGQSAAGLVPTGAGRTGSFVGASQAGAAAGSNSRLVGTPATSGADGAASTTDLPGGSGGGGGAWYLDAGGAAVSSVAGRGGDGGYPGGAGAGGGAIFVNNPGAGSTSQSGRGGNGAIGRLTVRPT